MGKISTFVNWNRLKNSYHYEIMQTSRGQHIFCDAKSANFMKIEGFEGYTRPEQNVRFRLFFQVLLYFYIIRRCTMKWTWVMEQLIGKISMRNFSVLSSRYSLYYCEVCKWHSYYQTLSLNLIKKTAPWFIYKKSAILFVKVRTCSESMYNRKYIWYCSLKISSSEKANHC
jgi:hypothetical protein